MLVKNKIIGFIMSAAAITICILLGLLTICGVIIYLFVYKKTDNFLKNKNTVLKNENKILINKTINLEKEKQLHEQELADQKAERIKINEAIKNHPDTNINSVNELILKWSKKK
jgi:predicted PurR-regulated permease PerM